MKNYKQMLYGLSAIAALGGGIHTLNVGYNMGNLSEARNTPAVQQIRSLEQNIHEHSKNPFSGNLQDIANKYQEYDKLVKNEECQKELREYNDAYSSMAKYAAASSVLIVLSLLLGGLATGKVRIGGKEND
ncbi:hypothetical protein HYT57_00630 [Candidatus Woesearchaeota archaeon]|nr:hypothetical protein [Candidatus Woesearchaeota archaeon]